MRWKLFLRYYAHTKHTHTNEHAHRKHPQKHTYRETHSVCRKSNLSPETKLDKKVGTYFLKVGKQSLIQNIRLFTCEPHWNTWSKLTTFSSASWAINSTTNYDNYFKLLIIPQR